MYVNIATIPGNSQDTKLKIKFSYGVATDKTGRNIDFTKRPHQADGGYIATVCEISSVPIVNEPVMESEGTAVCFPSDQFNKSKGRRMSLKRAIDSMGLTRLQRKASWFAYFENHREGVTIPSLEKTRLGMSFAAGMK